jgi:hypothetical protein
VKRTAVGAARKREAKGSMDAPKVEFYSKLETEIWIAFDCRGSEAKNRLHRTRRAWGARATMANLGDGRVVLVIRPGGARELAG